MGERGRHFLVLLCCAVTAGLAPASAGATQVAEFEHLRGTHGFGVGVWVKGRKASLIAIRSSKSPAVEALVAEYEARGRIDGDRVRAHFGGRGRVDVEFEQEGETVRWTPPPRCEGEPRKFRSGVFVGTIEFQGERGFATVGVSRLRGKLKTIPKWECKGLPPTPPIHAVPSIDTAPAVLEATRGGRGRQVFFRAVAARAPGEKSLTSFTGGRIETRPGLRVRRFGIVWSTQDSTFLFDDRLTGATLDPPLPFDGSGAFARETGGASWRGSLTVDLPGAGQVRLAGNGFSTRLYRGEASDSPGY